MTKELNIWNVRNKWWVVAGSASAMAGAILVLIATGMGPAPANTPLCMNISGMIEVAGVLLVALSAATSLVLTASSELEKQKEKTNLEARLSELESRIDTKLAGAPIETEAGK